MFYFSFIYFFNFQVIRSYCVSSLLIFLGMKGPSKGHLTLLTALLSVSLCAAVPVLDKAPSRSLHDELYQAAKRSSRPHMSIDGSPSTEDDRQEWIVDEK